MEGDRAHGCVTLPIRFGVARSARIIAPFFVGDSGAPRFAAPGRYPFGPSHPMALAEVRRGAARGYVGGELSWTLEDNVMINRGIERMGARRYKTYRVFEKTI